MSSESAPQPPPSINIIDTPDHPIALAANELVRTKGRDAGDPELVAAWGRRERVSRATFTDHETARATSELA